MRRKLYLLLAVMLASGMFAAGCGGGDDDGGDGGAAVDSCKQSVDQAQGLSSGVKNDLRDICEKADSGDEGEARKASQDVCVKIVEETIPSGGVRDQAVDACKQSGSQ